MCKCCKAAKVTTSSFPIPLSRSSFLSLCTAKIKTITHFYCCSSHESQIESEHGTKKLPVCVVVVVVVLFFCLKQLKEQATLGPKLRLQREMCF